MLSLEREHNEGLPRRNCVSEWKPPSLGCLMCEGWSCGWPLPVDLQYLCSHAKQPNTLFVHAGGL